jgi:hypothetical protein
VIAMLATGDDARVDALVRHHPPSNGRISPTPSRLRAIVSYAHKVIVSIL